MLKIISPDADIDNSGPLVLLDRDGVINRDRPDYVRSWDDFEFLPGVLGALRLLRDAGLSVALASNQSGVARGLLTVEELVAIHGGMAGAAAEAGGEVAAAFYCIHGPDEGCPCRKPKAALLLAALEEFGAEPYLSFMVGDAARDIAAGRGAGLTTVLVKTGHARGYSAEKIASLAPDFVADDLMAAARLIIDIVKKRG